MITKLYSSTLQGIISHPVTIEIKIHPAKSSKFFIVGMGDTAIQESRKRITAAIESSGYTIIEREIMVNLAPADLKKEGSVFDFPIAVGILNEMRMMRMPSQFLKETMFFGELSFDGSLQPIKGILSMTIDAKARGIKNMIVPLENFHEASLIPNINIVGIKSIIDFVSYLKDEEWKQSPIKEKEVLKSSYRGDFSDIKGQVLAKRVCQIAAAGNHNMIMVGPPGSGKTMISERMRTIMPELTFDEIIEITRVYSINGLKEIGLVEERPFRTPHHGISQAGMVGGGSPPRPGEISLAHNGILFLDEFTEFKRSVIEGLRQPLESKTITVTRAQASVDLPASFLLIAAMNPCPCGHLGDNKKPCTCTHLNIYSYLKKISGPFLDRIDLQLFLQAVDISELANKNEETSESLRQKVIIAREVQKKRGIINSLMGIKEIEQYCTMTQQAENILKFAFDKFQMSMRSYHKIIKISRTIADMEQAEIISEQHVKEALLYRGIDQKLTFLKSKL